MKDFEYSKEELSRIKKFSETFSIINASSVLDYGKVVQDKLTTLSSSILNKSKEKDTDEINSIIQDILSELNQMNRKKEKKSFFSFFNKQDDTQSKEINYNRILDSIEVLEEKLKEYIITLNTDLQLIELLKDSNEEYLRELNMYLLAGNLIIERNKAERESVKDDELQYVDYGEAIDRFEKKIYALELTRTIGVQMGPEITLMRDNIYNLINKIYTLINLTIPLCKNQIVILLSQRRQKDIMTEQNEISVLLNEALQDNAEGLSEMSQDLSNELKQGIISEQTLEQTLNSLLNSINEISNQKVEEKQEQEVEEPIKLELDNSYKDIMGDVKVPDLDSDNPFKSPFLSLDKKS